MSPASAGNCFQWVTCHISSLCSVLCLCCGWRNACCTRQACVCRRWLLGLLVLQSMSSFVLDSYQELLRNHLVVTLFLTMLVGAGGNAGNQSAIKVIRGLVSPSLSELKLELSPI